MLWCMLLDEDIVLINGTKAMIILNQNYAKKLEAGKYRIGTKAEYMEYTLVKESTQIAEIERQM